MPRSGYPWPSDPVDRPSTRETPLGGVLCAETRPGQRSRFHFLFPCRARLGTMPRNVSPSASGNRGQNMIGHTSGRPVQPPRASHSCPTTASHTINRRAGLRSSRDTPPTHHARSLLHPTKPSTFGVFALTPPGRLRNLVARKYEIQFNPEGNPTHPE